MEEDNWEIALKQLYTDESGIPKALSTKQFIEENTELDGGEAEKAIEYLDKMGLLTHEGMGSHELTEKGFDVAHQRVLREERLEHEEELAEQRDAVNSIIAYLTLGIIAVTAIDTAVRAYVGIGVRSNLILVLPGISLLAGVALTYKLSQLDLLK